MTTVLKESGAAIAVITGLSFILSLVFQYTSFFVLGLNLLQLFTFADYVNLVLAWLPPFVIAAVVILYPLFALYPLAVLAWFERVQSGSKHKPTMLSLVVTTILVIGLVGMVLYLFTYYINSQSAWAELIVTRRLAWLDRGCLVLGSVLATFAYVAFRRNRNPMVLALGGATSGLVIALYFGIWHGLDLLQSTNDYFNIECEPKQCSGQYKVAYLLERYAILIPFRREKYVDADGAKRDAVRIVVIPRDKIQMMTKLDVPVD